MLAEAAALTIAWTGGFGTGDFSQWDAIHQAADRDNVAIVAVGGHETVGRFQVEPGDVWPPLAPVSGERAEVLKSLPRVGFEQWRWQVRFPRRFHPSEGRWNIFTQFHQTSSFCVPTAAFHVYRNGARKRLALTWRSGTVSQDVCDVQSQDYDLGKFRRNHWFRFRLNVRWSDRRKGHIAVWVDGTKRVDADRRTLFHGQWVYLKQGFYRGASISTSVVFIDGTQVRR